MNLQHKRSDYHYSFLIALILIVTVLLFFPCDKSNNVTDNDKNGIIILDFEDFGKNITGSGYIYPGGMDPKIAEEFFGKENSLLSMSPQDVYERIQLDRLSKDINRPKIKPRGGGMGFRTPFDSKFKSEFEVLREEVYSIINYSPPEGINLKIELKGFERRTVDYFCGRIKTRKWTNLWIKSFPSENEKTELLKVLCRLRGYGTAGKTSFENGIAESIGKIYLEIPERYRIIVHCDY